MSNYAAAKVLYVFFFRFCEMVFLENNVHYSNLSFIFSSQTAQELCGQRLVLFSYGSGLASSMFSFRLSQDASPGSQLEALASSCADLKARLDSRRKIDPAQFEQSMKLREETHHLGIYP